MKESARESAYAQPDQLGVSNSWNYLLFYFILVDLLIIQQLLTHSKSKQNNKKCML